MRKNEKRSELPRELTLIDVHQVSAAMGVHPRTLKRMVSAGEFPSPMRLGTGRIRRWRLSDVEAFIAGKAKEVRR